MKDINASGSVVELARWVWVSAKWVYKVIQLKRLHETVMHQILIGECLGN